MPDLTAMVPLASAQRLYLRSLPSLVAGSLDQATIVNGLTIYPRPGADPEALAGVIRAAEPDLVVATAGDFDRQIGSLTAVLNGILVGVALISLVVGGLSVINTMAMSVAERTREIGVRRAIGASRLRIVGSLVAESGLIGLIGGVVGLAGGALVVLAANELGRTSGFVLFLLTPWTALTALLFSTGLGALAGLVPALHAARLDPVAALRYE
jgi:putative ABC transport system permease protein